MWKLLCGATQLPLLAVIKNSNKCKNTDVGRSNKRTPGGTMNSTVAACMAVVESFACFESKWKKLKIKLANVLKIKNKFMDKLHLQRGIAAVRLRVTDRYTIIKMRAARNTFWQEVAYMRPQGVSIAVEEYLRLGWRCSGWMCFIRAI